MKSTKAEAQKRVEEVLSLRLLGAEFLDIRQHASAQKWDVSDRQLWRYIAAGDELLARTLERDREKLFRRHIAQRRALYARTMAASDYSTAARILKDEAELCNLYPHELNELIEKMAKEISELKAKHGHSSNAPKTTDADAGGPAGAPEPGGSAAGGPSA